MTTYKIYSNNPDMVTRDDGASIPIAEKFETRFGNPDYQKYAAWLDEGNKPEYIDIVEVEEKQPTEQVFALPIRAPLVTASDFIVQSPKPKKGHLEAHAEAIAEAAKADKSIALIVLDLVVYIAELEKRLQKAKI